MARNEIEFRDKNNSLVNMLLPEKNPKNHSYSDAHFCLELGKAYNKNKDYTQAIEELNKAVQLGHDDAEVHRELGIAYREKRKYDLAIKELKFALNHNPSDSGIHFELGHLYSENKDYTSAIEQLSRAIELGLDNFEVYLELGRAYRATEDFPKAIEALNSALGHNPSDGRIHLELGRVYIEKNDFDLAIKELKKAQELGLDNEEVHFELGRIFSQKKDYAKAIEEFHYLIKLNPQNGQFHVELAMNYEQKKEYSLAIQEFQKALRKGFDEECGRQNLLRLSDKQRVLEEFDKFIEITPCVEGEFNLGIITEYIFQEGYDSFIKKLNEIAKFKPKNLRVHIELAWVYSWHKQFDLVIEELKKISEIALLNPNLCNEFSKIYDPRKERDLMIKEFENAIQINSNIYKQDANLKNEYISTLKDLFPNRTREIDFLLKNLASMYSFYKWRYPAMTKAEGEILYLIARLLKPKIIIEAGTWMGTNTSYLAKACCDNGIGKVITVDNKINVGYAVPAELLPYVEFHKGVDIKDELPIICNKETKVDMFFHDSGNSCELILWEIEKVLPLFSRGGLIIAHDALNYTKPPGSNVAYFFNEIKDEVKCYFFKTGMGLGVIRDIEKPNFSGCIHLKRARIYQEKKDYDSSLRELGRAIELGIENSKIHFELGRRYLRLHLELAKIYRKMEDYDLALKELNQAAELDPHNGQVYSELSYTYLEKGGCELAIKELQTILSFNPSNAHIHFELGRVYQKKKYYDLALKELNQAIELGLDNAMVHLELGKTFREKRDFDSAIKALRKAVELGLDNDELHLELGRIYRDQNREALAKKEFQTALRLNPQNGEAYAELAWVHIRGKKYALAIKEVQEALQKGFNKEDAGQIFDKIHHNQRVIQEFEKAMETAPEVGNLTGCITEYIFQEGYKNFIKRLKEITKINPKNLRAHIELAWVYSWHKQYDLAIEELNRINEITSQDKTFLTELTITYLCKKEYALAIEEFKKTLQIISNSNNQNDILKKEFILTLKDLFPDRTEETKDSIKNLPTIRSLYNWRYPGITREEGELLYIMVRLLKPDVIVEAGTWMGTSTSYLARGCCDNKMGKVITIDQQDDVGYAIPEDLLAYIEFYKNVDIRDALPGICNKESKIDMFFHDSTNSYELLLWEVNEILPFISEEGLIIVHDTLNLDDAPGKDVARFFDEIKDQAKSHLFNTEKGIGVIKDVGRLKAKW